ncbi:methyl-accepting chemotaxis protein [Paenibacillus sp. GCM10012307]|uniref:HAMP domain-containing protein n=1 Tax=Paenibacillus roseus TaxID=2798579 RepID=A0A934J3I9_9BACL|nr:methyl-accepting chemotaxis protein [Paenibacillus roseus]MBJ6360171.1 HAMP domain-containing protein [Paenibacillus roseus]
MRWFTNRSVKTKLVTSICIALVLAFGALLYSNIIQLHSLTLEKGELNTMLSADDASDVFQDKLTRLEASLKTMGQVLLDASNNGTFSRAEGVRLLEEELKRQPDLLAIYTLWEPNAFDGQDTANKNKELYDDNSGRYLPYLVREGNNILVEPLEYYSDPNSEDSQYYYLPKSTKRTYWSEPMEYKVNGKDIFLNSVTVPVLDKKGNFVAIVGADFSLDFLQKMTETLKPLGGYASIISEKGVFVSNGRYPDEINTQFANRPDKVEIWNKVLQGDYRHYAIDRNGAKVIRIFTPITIQGSDNRMYMQTTINEAVVLEEFNRSLVTTIVTAVVLLVILGLLVYVFVHLIVKQIAKVNQLSVRLAQGDFTGKLEVRNRDEIGSMTARLNEMMEKLRMTIKTVSDHSLSIGATSEQLTASAEQTGKAAELIAASIQEVAAGAESQRNDASETARTMNELAAGIDKIATSASELADSSQVVEKQTRDGNEFIQASVRQMAIVSDSVEESSRKIRQLNDKSEAISRFVGIISGISSQTNILALNAAIEASRVGEHGRGFAVVAEEVRKLAEQSNQAARQISELIQEILVEISAASLAMGQGALETERGVEAVENSGRIFASILEEMAGVNTQVSELSAASEQMSASVEEVTASVAQMEHIAEKSATNAQHVAAASEEQLATMEEVSAAASQLSNMVEELVALMSKFKT